MRQEGNKTGWRKKRKNDAIATGPSAHPIGICGAWVDLQHYLEVRQEGQDSVPCSDQYGEGLMSGKASPLGLPRATPGEGCSSELSATDATSSWGNECFTPESWRGVREGLAVLP